MSQIGLETAVSPAIGHASPLSTGIVQGRSTAPMLSPHEEPVGRKSPSGGKPYKLRTHPTYKYIYAALLCAGVATLFNPGVLHVAFLEDRVDRCCRGRGGTGRFPPAAQAW